MDSLFGVEVTWAIRLIIAFVVVLALIAVTAWLVRQFGRGALTSAGGRGRQPRLAVIDAASVDTRRKLVLVRRDNVEHLLMIGGPSDVVIEPNIVRATAASRDITAPRAASVQETISRPAPPEEGTLWPLQPEPAPRAQRPLQPAATPAAAQLTPAAPPLMDTAGRAPLPPDTLTELADALAPQPSGRGKPKRALEPVFEPAEIVASQVASAATTSTAPHLPNIAEELEAALRQPAHDEARLDIPAERTPTEPAISSPTSTGEAPENRMADAPDTAPALANVKRAAADTRPVESKNFYETLEQEMASLLGRATGKT